MQLCALSTELVTLPATSAIWRSLLAVRVWHLIIAIRHVKAEVCVGTSIVPVRQTMPCLMGILGKGCCCLRLWVVDEGHIRCRSAEPIALAVRAKWIC